MLDLAFGLTDTWVVVGEGSVRVCVCVCVCDGMGWSGRGGEGRGGEGRGAASAGLPSGLQTEDWAGGRG